METLSHPFPPVYDETSRILILGSFPSVKSREAAFFYGHPQNRFWRVLAAVFGESVPETVADKTALLLRRRVALWVVAAACEVAGSSDASIRAVVPNDLSPIFRAAAIRAVFCNGGTAYRYYEKFNSNNSSNRGPAAEAAAVGVKLPSTSPANARWTLPMLVEAWGNAILPYL